MKKLCVFLLFITLIPVCVHAEVIPAYGQGQIGYEAVVLCQSLTVRESRNTASKALQTLKAGSIFATRGCTDGWLDCFPSENEGQAGWVKADYVIVDPAWYKTDAATAVYAWNSENAHQVGLLDRGETYPILKTEGEWLCIGLRGASGWIHDPQGAIQARDAAFYPADLAYIIRAEVTTPDGAVHALDDPAALSQLDDLMVHCHVSFPSKCPFDATLSLTLVSGRTVALEVATDSCHVFRTPNGVYYEYGDNVPHEPDSSSMAGELFWSLFGLSSYDLHN